MPWDIPAAWQPALDEMTTAGGTCVVLGAVDTGKSTFCAVLADAPHQRGRRVAVVDGDLGQSDLGPPAAISMGLLNNPIERLEQIPVAAIYFVGSVSPERHLLPVVVGLRKLTDAARGAGADFVVVDTHGLVHGGAGRALKEYKLDLLAPEFVVALQREGEIEHLLAAYWHAARPKVFRLAPSKQTRLRDRDRRAAARQANFRRYFREARPVELSLDKVAIQGSLWRSGQPLPGHLKQHAADTLGCTVLWAERTSDGILLIAEGCRDLRAKRGLSEVFPGSQTHVVRREALEYLLVGLLDGCGDTKALGIVTKVDFARGVITIVTPLQDLQQVKAIRLGAMNVSPDGTELGWHDPGELG